MTWRITLSEIHPYIRRTFLSTLRDWLIIVSKVRCQRCLRQCVYRDVISYSNSRATVYRKLVQRKSAVPWRVLLYSRIHVSMFRPTADVPPFYVRVNFVPRGSRVSELADRQLQTTLNIILQADLTERFCNWRSANLLMRDPLEYGCGKDKENVKKKS